jgi:phosphoenolpyruvate synthase/pyruvate phosphate dikinase
MHDFIIPLDTLGATDASVVGPKAANLAMLARAGLPTPGGFCLTADAYRHQIAHLKIDELVDAFTDASTQERRRLSVDIRIKLYEEPIAPEILEPLMAAWRAQRTASGQPGAIRRRRWSRIAPTRASRGNSKASSASSMKGNS